MRPIRTPRTTSVDLGPVGSNVDPLPTWREVSPEGGIVVLSVWEPTPEERAAIAAGANVVLGVWAAQTPPVYVGIGQGEQFEPLVRLERGQA